MYCRLAESYPLQLSDRNPILDSFNPSQTKGNPQKSGENQFTCLQLQDRSEIRKIDMINEFEQILGAYQFDRTQQSPPRLRYFMPDDKKHFSRIVAYKQRAKTQRFNNGGEENGCVYDSHQQWGQRHYDLDDSKKHRQRRQQQLLECQRKLCSLQQKYINECQAFNQEKAQWEKQLVIKEGQIQMLQKLLLEKVDAEGERKASMGEQLDQNQQHIKNPLLSAFGRHCKSKFTLRDRKPSIPKPCECKNRYQKLVNDKERQIEALLTKLTEINSVLQHKNHSINSLKYENMVLISTVQSLKNNLYVVQKKAQNGQGYRIMGKSGPAGESKQSWSKLTQTCSTKQTVPHQKSRAQTPKKKTSYSFSKHKTLEDYQSPENDNDKKNKLVSQQLEKRLEMLKVHRIEIEQRECNRRQRSKQRWKYLNSLEKAKKLKGEKFSFGEGIQQSKQSQKNPEATVKYFWNLKTQKNSSQN